MFDPEIINHQQATGEPFLFMISFEAEDVRVIPLDMAIEEGALFDIKGRKNFQSPLGKQMPAFFEKFPVGYEEYKRSFDIVQNEERNGNSYLVNLTFPTRIKTDLSLEKIFQNARADYKLLYKDKFTVFSPESFINIENGIISTFPMKGTIDASVPNAESIILDDPKESAEHLTTVDLLRNDLGMVARNINISRYRFISKIHTNQRDILQVSSEITGELEHGLRHKFGTVLSKLLPAGSVTGAPKKKTLEIIRQAENSARGWYTGIFGIADQNRLECAVMIRFIEKTVDGLVYRSGGGITVYSDPEKEYQELKDKVYVPID